MTVLVETNGRSNTGYPGPREVPRRTNRKRKAGSNHKARRIVARLRALTHLTHGKECVMHPIKIQTDLSGNHHVQVTETNFEITKRGFLFIDTTGNAQTICLTPLEADTLRRFLNAEKRNRDDG